MAWWRESGFTLRRLVKSPGFVMAAVVSVGLGIAANATIFAMVSRFVLKPAAAGNPETLLSLHTTWQRGHCCNAFEEICRVFYMRSLMCQRWRQSINRIGQLGGITEDFWIYRY